MRRKIIVVVFMVLLVAIGTFVWYGQQKSRNVELYYSGTIEAIQSELAFQVSGRVFAVNVREGQQVDKGQVLAELDPSEYQSRSEQAKANLERSIRNREQLETALSIYERTLPEDVNRAQANVESARDTLEKAQRNRDRYAELFKKQVVSEREWDTVRLDYETARARHTEAQAALKQTQSNLRRIALAKQEIEAAAAQIRSNRAALEQAELQLAYTKLAAPYRGTITSKNVEPGEVVSPGRQALTLADLSTVDLKIYVDETQIGKVKPGQPVDVKIDTFPNRVFRGQVSFISPEGEFTPKIIQTQKERVKLVYLVKVSIPNSDFALKTGMPADAWLR